MNKHFLKKQANKKRLFLINKKVEKVLRCAKLEAL